MKIFLHPESCTSPAAVAEVERATGLVAIFCGAQVELRPAAATDGGGEEAKNARGEN